MRNSPCPHCKGKKFVTIKGVRQSCPLCGGSGVKCIRVK